MRLKRFGLVGVFFLLVIVSLMVIFNQDQVHADFFSDSTGKLTGNVISGLGCSVSWSGSTWTGNHNEAGMTQNGVVLGDTRFFCYEGNFYECTWELDDPSFATKVDVGTKISNYVCTGAWVTTCSSEDQIILKLSSDTNAHGAAPDGDGIHWGVCYDQIFGETGDGNRVCSGNTVLRLSGSTNAHAEGPNEGGSGYTDVCYGDLTCVARPSASGCETWESLVVSLSDTTNAHLSDSAGYGIDICCRFPVCRPRSVSWSTNDAIEGQIVNLDVTTSNCDDGELISFEVWEDDTTSPDDLIIPNPLNAVVSGGIAQGSWVAEYQDDFDPFPFGGDPEYYFKATAISTGEQKETDREDEDFLRVSEYFIPPSECLIIVMCSDYDNQINCDSDGCNVANFSVGNNINCDDPNKMCACSWLDISSSCNATWTGFTGGEEIGECTYSQNTGDNCNDGFLTFSWTANWTWEEGKGAADDPENLFGECIDGSRTIECPAQIPLPFFGAYNFIVALIIIALIYVLWGSGSGKNRKKK